MHKLRIAVIGVGHLGRHHARILAGLPGVELVGVSDSNTVRCGEVAARLGVPGHEDYRKVVDLVDAASIVVPTSAHYQVARTFLAAGKSLLVEKPLAADPAQAEQLVALARLRHATLQVGHIERFNPVLRGLPPRPQPPKLIEAHRLGPYSFRSTDISVVFDLMIHDLDIVLALVGELPECVTASAWPVFGGLPDVATAQLTFRCGTMAHLTASRAAPGPRREMNVWWPDGCARVDFASQRSVSSIATEAFRAARSLFLNPTPEQIPRLRESLRAHYFQVTEKDWTGGTELLAIELEHFVSCVRNRTEPLVNGEQARNAVLVAAAVEQAAHRWPEPFVLSLSRAAVAA